MKKLLNLIRPFWNPSAWVLIFVGAILFAGRVSMPPEASANLPELATFIELVGGLLILTGFQIMASMLFWPETKTVELTASAMQGNLAAAVLLAGLKVFNGLSLIAFAIWMALALNGSR
jgi:hypothetical protein